MYPVVHLFADTYRTLPLSHVRAELSQAAITHTVRLLSELLWIMMHESGPYTRYPDTRYGYASQSFKGYRIWEHSQLLG